MEDRVVLLGFVFSASDFRIANSPSPTHSTASHPQNTTMQLVGRASVLLLAAVLLAPKAAQAFNMRQPMKMSATATKAGATSEDKKVEEPLLLRAARGEKVERPPVWMMRQAGRHMAAYRELVKKYPTFRERSEIPDVSTEISLQPWQAYKTDGVILFSDILTPLPGMGVEFTIEEKTGPKIKPIRTWEAVKQMRLMDCMETCPFVHQTLTDLRKEVGNEATVLGFVGLPYTLATYLVEGSSSKEYLEIKKMMFQEPALLQQMLSVLADNIGEYACFQIESGAQVIQIFDSWAGHLAPLDYDVFAAPYQRQVIEKIKAKHPSVPIIMYINKSGALLERMAQTGVDMVSLDWTVTMEEGRRRLGSEMGVQGNLDPAILYAPKEVIKERTEQILREGKGYKHVMNLGHGIEATTPEENAAFFVETCKAWRY